MTVVPYDRNLPEPARQTYDAAWLADPAEIARRIGGTDFVPKAIRDNPAAITAALLYGAEVGLKGPMQALRSIAVIDGRPAMAAEAMRSLILAAGHELVVEESTVTRCVVVGRRRDSDFAQRVTWTLDDAKRARIAGKPNWQAYPRQMLKARATAELARDLFADVIAGMPALEELEDLDDAGARTALVESGLATEAPAEPKTRRRRRTATTATSPASSGSASAMAEPEPQGAQQQTPAADPTPAAGGETEPAPEPAADAPAEPNPPTDRAMRNLFRLFGEKGMRDRDARLDWSKKTLGRDIGSSTELDALDVNRLIEALEELDDAPAATLPANEQAVVDELERELDAAPEPDYERPPLPDDEPA